MKLKRLAAVCLAAAVAASLVACSGTKITSISLEPEVSIKKGDTYQLEIQYDTEKEIAPEKLAELVSKCTFEWYTNNDAVAIVDETGLVTAQDVGTTEIGVRDKSAKLIATCMVTVNNPVTGINVSKSLDFTVGDKAKNVNASVNPKDAVGYEIRYESSDEKIATVDKDGNVTPVAEGECVIKTTAVASTVESKVVDENKADSSSAANSSESNAASSEAASESASSAVSSEASSDPSSETEGKKDADQKAEILASNETKVVVKAAKAENADDDNTTTTSTTTSNGKNNTVVGSTNKTSTSNSAASSAGSSSSNGNTSSAGSSSGSSASTPAASTPAPAPVQPAEPTPAPAPVQPNPAPAPDPVPAPEPDPAPAPEPDPAPTTPNGPIYTEEGSAANATDGYIGNISAPDEGDGGDAEPMPD